MSTLKRILPLALLLPAVLLVAGPTELEAPSASVVTDPDAAEIPGFLTIDPAHLSPLMREIRSAWEAQAVAVAALETRLETAADATEFLALQRQIEDLRVGTEVRFLEIQARHARSEGRLDAAARLEAAVARMTAPPPRAEPVARPAPAARGE